MRPFLIYLIALLPFISLAQNSSGEVTYLETLDLRSRIQFDNPELAEMLPPSQESRKQLLFTPEASLYRDHPEQNEPQEYSKEGDGMSIRMKISRSQNARYCDLKTGESVERRDFLGKTFLIEQEEDKAITWKITGEQKMIADQLCLRAVHAEGDSSEEAIAWFAPQIPVGIGPGKYGQLPGLILRLELEQGTRIFTAEEIKLRPVSPEEMPLPQEGKKVTREKYDQIVAEKRAEMQMENGGNGTFRIIRQN